jgi:hypothetical protein
MDVETLFDKHGLVTLNAESINIQGVQGWAMISMDVLSGTVIVTGIVDYMGTKVTGSVTFPAGKSMTFGSGISAVDDLTIDASSGVCALIGVKVKNPY